MDVAIIGGGFCGVACARKLVQLMPQAQVSIFSPDTHFEYHGDLYKVLAGASPHLTRISYHQLINHPNIKLINEPVMQLNPETKTVTTTNNTFPFDYACIAIGAQATFYDIAGIKEHAHVCRSTKSATQLHSLVLQKIHEQDELEVIIAGAGPAGIEFAGHLAALCVQYRHPYSITLIDAAAQILPSISDAERNHIFNRLKELNIQLQLDTHIKRYKDDVIETDKGSLYADIVLWCAGQMANHIPSTGIPLSTTAKGAYAVNEYLQTSQPTIYAGGDCSSAKDAGLAWSAVSHGAYIAEHIVDSSQHEPTAAYAPPQYPFVLPIGPHWAIAKHNNHVSTGFAGNVLAKQLKAQLWAELLQ